MSEGALFGSQFSPVHSRFRLRLWAADLVDLAIALPLAWGAARALDWEQSLTRLLGTFFAIWVLLSLLGGVRGWTLGRRLLHIRLVDAQGRPPGLPRAFARAFASLPDLFMTPLLPSRPLDRLLQVHGERPETGLKARLVGVGLQLPWVAALAAAAWFIATPTRHEAFDFLGHKLTGYKCCNGYRKHMDTWMCRHSLSRLVREASQQEPDALTLLAECPQAAERMPR